MKVVKKKMSRVLEKMCGDKMKKILCILLCVILGSGISACGDNGGNVDAVKIIEAESDQYSTDDINSAIDTIVKEFDDNWDGCTLTEIYYAGDEYSSNYQDWADRNDADEVIVLLSSFDVDSSGGDGSLNPDSTYDNWMWILVRNKDGEWKHVDHGF